MSVEALIGEVRALLDRVHGIKHVINGGGLEQSTISDMKDNAKDLCDDMKSKVDDIKSEIDNWS